MSDGEGHRTQYADLVRMLDQGLRELQRPRAALEAKDLKSLAILAWDHGDQRSTPPRALLANRRPRLTSVQVEDCARERVVDRGTVEDREHEPEHRHALLGVEAAVDRVDQDQRIVGAKAAQARLLGENGERLTTA